jgi:hypothetical protein
MKQSRAVSLIEALANVAAGFGLALLTQLAVFPLFGLTARPLDHLRIALVFTAVSVARSYLLRRLFARWSG